MFCNGFEPFVFASNIKKRSSVIKKMVLLCFIYRNVIDNNLLIL